ncbi:trypsin-like serine protease [Streptomyces tropicalis]|uniref:Trypsin-like peptidase domain-containing protein n=1 Tax=Streptomyces tropicalis TaxID=3034234 RepID=A0ABT6A632_9ACTN|nr:trypsin-like serine protease [Streptomyces tropicalis]MDF3300101.1 trypsin-like peptidase domain-containing protein [Streptomyces tropicalis]
MRQEDREDHPLPDRVVETVMDLGGGRRQWGTGYLIADRAVLTARHLVVDANGHPGRVVVHGMFSSEPLPATVVWTPASTTVDVALLELAAPSARLKNVRWGRIDGGRPREVSGVGFPSRQGRNPDGVRHSDHLWGWVTLQPRRNVLSVDVGGATRRPLDMRDGQEQVKRWQTSQWSGASGTALFCGPHLVGVLSRDADPDTYDGTRLHAVPVSAWWDDPEFVRQRRRLGLDAHCYPVSDPAADTSAAASPLTRTSAEEDLRLAIAQQIGAFTSGWHGVSEEADQALDVHCSAVDGEEYARNAQAIPITHDSIDAYYLALSPRRLVITGPSGSGKTILALRLMRRLLDVPGQPVPVYFNLAAWRVPSADIRRMTPDARPRALAKCFEGWLVDQLLENDLVVTRRDAQRLVEGRRILPVLDGMDQILPDRASAEPASRSQNFVLDDLVCALNSYRDIHGGSRGALVLATRARKDFESETCDIPLPEGSVVQVERLTWRQIQEHLESGRGPRDQKTNSPVDWGPVLGDIAAHGDQSVAARRLDTPWKLTLAEWAAASHHVTPAYLITPDTSDADVEEELLASFVPSVHGYHSVHTSGTSGKSPQQAMNWLTVLAQHLEQSRGTVHGVSLSGREVVLARIWPVAGTWRVRFAHLAVHTVPLMFFGLACVIAAVSGPGHAGDFFTGHWPAFTSATGTRLTWALCLSGGLLVAGAYFALRYWPWMPPTHWPLLAFAQRRTQGLRIRRGPRRIVSGVEIGSAIGLGVGMAVMLAFGWVLGIAVGAVVAALFGWFMEAKVGLDRTLSGNFAPEFFWALDMLGAVAFAGLGALVFPWLDYSWTTGLAFGGCFGFVLGFGFFLVPWLRYITAMTLARKELPWRLAAFLDWARKAGLMTISGVGFQFRHQELQEWIVRKRPPSPSA